MSAPHHDELFLVIGRLEGKVDSLLSMQCHPQDQLKNHDSRLRVLEHARGQIMGYAAAIGAGMSILVNYFSKHIS